MFLPLSCHYSCNHNDLVNLVILNNDSTDTGIASVSDKTVLGRC